MTPTIRIDDEIWEVLKKNARPFEDTPNTVLRRLLQLTREDANRSDVRESRISHGSSQSISRRGTGEKTRQAAYRNPLLKALLKLGGKGSRIAVLTEVERMMASMLTSHDKSDIPSGGMARWQKTAEFEAHAMRKMGLLRPEPESGRGVWELTNDGEEAARALGSQNGGGNVEL